MVEALGNNITYTNYVEAGLSADPLMIRRISDLNKVSLISNSDGHSPYFYRIGRKATIFYSKKLNYRSLIDSTMRNTIITKYDFNFENFNFILILLFLELCNMVLLIEYNLSKGFKNKLIL